jgi:pimeloyl-ACP methyl ester carboxylesterase
MLGQPLIGLFLAAPPKALLRHWLRAVVRQKHAVPEALVDVYYRYRHMPGAAPALVELVRQGTHHGKIRPEALLTPKLKGCPAPTLFILGTDDPIVSRRSAEVVAATMPKASLWLVPECGHAPHREYPEAFNQRLLAFLGENYPA